MDPFGEDDRSPTDDRGTSHRRPMLPARAARDLLGRGLGLDTALQRWAAEATVDEAARARTRRRWLEVQAEEEASFVGALIDLAERGRPVTVDAGGQRWRGVVVGIGTDFLALRGDHGQHVLVRTSDVAAVRAEPGGVEVRGDRAPMLEVGFAGVLGPVAAERPDVLVRSRDGVSTRGALRSAGRDVLRLRVDGEPPTPVWVPVSSVAVLIIDP